MVVVFDEGNQRGTCPAHSVEQRNHLGHLGHHNAFGGHPAKHGTQSQSAEDEGQHHAGNRGWMQEDGSHNGQHHTHRRKQIAFAGGFGMSQHFNSNYKA